jgi:hypothetical protein
MTFKSTLTAMLKLTPTAWAALCENDACNFVTAVRKDLERADPALAANATLEPRLQEAAAYARALGLHDDHTLIAFLRLETYAPNFWRHPVIDVWLRKPGASVQARFDALRAEARFELRQKEEKNRW